MIPSSPLSLPVQESEAGVQEPAHLGQRPLLVDADEEVGGGGVLEGDVHGPSQSADSSEVALNRAENQAKTF